MWTNSIHRLADQLRSDQRGNNSTRTFSIQNFRREEGCRASHCPMYFGLVGQQLKCIYCKVDIVL